MNPAKLLPPWDVCLPHDLRLSGEAVILRPLGLTVHDYSTARFFTADPSKKKELVGSVSLGAAIEPVPVEAFNAALLKYCDDRGLNPRDSAEATLACHCLSEAAQHIVGLVPCCMASVTELVRTIHLIGSAGEDYDSSHSDPAIPFSIFISVPSSPGRRSLLRVAEGLVHEAMHLQLTLFEAICPLVDGSVDWGLYSPWKQTKRQTQGILHGLYVFGVLRWMWQEIKLASGSRDDLQFSEQRIQEIDEELKAVRAVVDSPALTSEGKNLAEALLGNAIG